MYRNSILFLVLCGLLVLTARVWGVADEQDATAGATYLGEKSCKKCHMKQHRTWKKMKHAKAWAHLPEKYHNPDEKDEKGRACISCHVTGYGQGDRGGFVDAEKSAHLLGVQCETCHGPGSKHKEAGQKVLDEKRKKFNDGEPSFTVLTPTSCSNCHNPHVSHDKYAAKGAGG